jgi:hypothetical protein
MTVEGNISQLADYQGTGEVSRTANQLIATDKMIRQLTVEGNTSQLADSLLHSY